MALESFKTISLTPDDFKLNCPTVGMLLGTTGSGKSSLLYHMLINREKVFSQKFSSIYFMYLYQQPIYSMLKEKLGDKIEFFQGYNQQVFEDETFLRRPALVLVDDLDNEFLNQPICLSLAKGLSHHSSLTCLVVSQQIFHSPRTAKYSSEFMKNCRIFFLLQIVKERYALAIFGRQLQLPGNYLLSVYHQTVEEPPVEKTLAPPHLLLNFGPNVKSPLRVIGNFIRPADTRSNDDDDTAADVRARVYWLFAEGNNNMMNRQTAVGGASSTFAPGERTAKPEGARLFYLLAENQMNALLRSTRPSIGSAGEESKQTTAAAGDVGNSPTLRTSTAESANPAVGEGSASKENAERWKNLIGVTLPSMLQYPQSVRKQAIALANYFRQHGMQLEEDGDLSYLDPDGDGQEMISENDVLNVLLYFVLPSKGHPVPRPRSLYSLCKVLRRAPALLFSNQKIPQKILLSLKKYYRN